MKGRKEAVYATTRLFGMAMPKCAEALSNKRSRKCRCESAEMQEGVERPSMKKKKTQLS